MPEAIGRKIIQCQPHMQLPEYFVGFEEVILKELLAKKNEARHSRGGDCSKHIIYSNYNNLHGVSGGGGGIRTHGTLTRTQVFKTCAFNRSATPPAFTAVLVFLNH